jgi:hypothetical protein
MKAEPHLHSAGGGRRGAPRHKRKSTRKATHILRLTCTSYHERSRREVEREGSGGGVSAERTLCKSTLKRFAPRTYDTHMRTHGHGATADTPPRRAAPASGVTPLRYGTFLTTQFAPTRPRVPRLSRDSTERKLCTRLFVLRSIDRLSVC